MFRKKLAWIFRTLNTEILYVKSWPAEKILKIFLLLSSAIYRSWVKKSRPSERLEIVVDRSIKMEVDPSKSIGAAFYWMGIHELNEWRFLNGFLTPNMVFLDVGANQGEFSLFAAKRLTGGQVFAFEPVSIFYEKLNNNVIKNKFTNITTFQFGLSDASRQVPVYMGQEVTVENEGLASVFQSSDRSRFIQQIDLKVLDEIVHSLEVPRIDFIKIDVEGSELMVLKGSRKTLQQYTPWVMLEISNDTYRSAGYSVNDVREFFNSIGYSLYTIGRAGRLTKATEIPSYCNVIFKPN